MEKHQIGVVQDLFRYPVKSMQGERLKEVAIGAYSASAIAPTRCARPAVAS
jgi:uncharacterized protein YcbX